LPNLCLLLVLTILAGVDSCGTYPNGMTTNLLGGSMKRNAAITAAATASLAAVAVSMGIALNLGILSSGNSGGGNVALAAEKSPAPTTAAAPTTVALPPPTTAPQPQTEYVTVYEDIFGPAAAAAPAPAIPAPVPAPAPALFPSTTPSDDGAEDSPAADDSAGEPNDDGEDEDAAGDDSHADEGDDEGDDSSEYAASSSASYTVADARFHARLLSLSGNGTLERVWRSLKYEDVYLHDYATLAEAHAGIARWIRFYNVRRPHQSLDNRTPMEVYRGAHLLRRAAA